MDKTNPLTPYRLYCFVFALKITLSCLVCFWIIGYFGLDQGYLFLLPIFIGPLSLPQRAQQTCWEIAIGDVIGALIFLPMVQLCDHWLVYLILNLVMLAIILLVGFKSRFLFTALFMVVTGGVIFSTAQSTPLQAVSYGISWSRDAVIGAAVYFIVDFVLLPRFAWGQLERTLRDFKIKFLPIEECQKLFQVSKYRISKDQADLLEIKIGVLGALQFYQKRAENYLEKLKMHPEFFIKLEPIYLDFIKKIDLLNSMPWEKLLLEIQDYLNQLLQDFSRPDELEIIEYAYALKKHMENMVRVITIPRDRKILDPAPLRLSFSSPFKTACLGAAILCLVVSIVSFLALPGGMQPVFSAFAAASQPNIGKLSKQLLDRFLGVLFGGAASMIILLTLGEISHLWMLVCLFSLFMTFFAYFGVTRLQWSYIFVQACATVVMLVTYDTLVLVPTIEVVGQRFFGIAIGFLIGFMIMALFGLDSAIAIFKLKFHSYLSRAGKIIFENQKIDPKHYSELLGLLSEVKVLLSHTEFELGASKDCNIVFKRQVFLLERVGYNLETLLGLTLHYQQGTLQTPWLAKAVNQWISELQKVLEIWPNTQASEKLNQLLIQMDQSLQKAFDNRELVNLSEDERTHAFALCQNVHGLAEGLTELGNFLLVKKI